MFKPIKVNGVIVHCGLCIHSKESPMNPPCAGCWRVIYCDSTRLEDIAFKPENSAHFYAVKKMIEKYKAQFAEMEKDALDLGISIDDVCKQFVNRCDIEVYVDNLDKTL